MKKFTNIQDVKEPGSIISKAIGYKNDPLKDKTLGKHKVLGLIFMNPSLRTRLSTQKAAMNLGMEVMVMNFSGEGWALETKDGVIMDGDKAEHIREAAAVIGQYCDIVGLRSFPELKDREIDYSDKIMHDFIRYSGKPFVSLESATLHPLQSLADIVTIELTKKVQRPKVVMTWAPHPRALPQSVPNSFAEWAGSMEYDFTITHPKGYELSDKFVKGVTVEHDQQKALQGADFVYVKNWSSYTKYGEILSTDSDWQITQERLANTNNARVMHCLPVRRNVVINEDVLDSDNSIVIEEAANREFAAQAVLSELILNN